MAVNQGQTLLSPVGNHQSAGIEKYFTPIKTKGDSAKESNEVSNEKTDKNKMKAKKNRELGDLEENAIMSARLRSDSGKVYSTSLTIDQATQDFSASKEPELETLEEESEMGDPSKLDQLIKMITKLQSSVDDIRKDTSGQQCVTANLRMDLDKVEESVGENADEIHNLKVELKEYRFQMQVIANVVVKQEQQIEILNRKLTEAQQRDMSANIVITGIDEKAKESTIQVFNNFVQDKLEIMELLPAKQAFRLGTGKNRPLLVELHHPENDKRKIFQNVRKLKGKMNGKGTPYFITDHLPEEMNETRRRTNDLVSANKKKSEEQRQNMEVRKGQLFINGNLYEKKIQTPNARQLFKPDQKMMDLADEIDMVKGKTVMEEKSKFLAYAAAVHTEEDIQAAYLKVKTKFSDATHVVCAYRLQNGDSPILEDYQDDGEFAAGRTILKALEKEGLKNIVVFMIRYYGGKHLGSRRYEIFKEVTLTALVQLQKRIQEQKRQEEEENEKREQERQQQLQDGWPTTPAPEEVWEKQGPRNDI